MGEAESKQAMPTQIPIPTKTIPKRIKKPNIHQKAKKKKNKSQMPSFDIITGRRNWGKNYKRKKKANETNIQRPKWKKKTVQITEKQTNPLAASRVLSILPIAKANEIKNTKQQNNNLNNEQKEEFASLFTNILKTVIHNETTNKANDDKSDKDMKQTVKRKKKK